MAKMTKRTGGGSGSDTTKTRTPKASVTPADSARASGARYDHGTGKLVAKQRHWTGKDMDMPIKGSDEIMSRTRAMNRAKAAAKSPAKAKKYGGRSK